MRVCELDPAWENEFLPKHPFKLNLHCWLIGPGNGDHCDFMALSFCAERPMHHLLSTKGRTAGLNADRSDGHNTRLGSSSKSGTDVFMVLDEEIISPGSTDFPFDDRLGDKLTPVPWADWVYAVNDKEAVSPAWFRAPACTTTA